MSRVISYGKAINEALHQEMERDANVFIIGEDVAKMGGDFGITQGIWHKWPDRAKDTPLSEQAIVGLACGAAICGLRPVAEMMFADFITCAYDQLVNNAAKLHFMFNGGVTCPIVVRAPQGAGIRCSYHHSHSVESWFMNIPGLVIAAPSTPFDAKGLLISSIKDDNPIIFLEHKMLYNLKGEVPEDYYELPLYTADIKKEGKDVTIVATLRMVHFALEAAEKLAAEGISAEVIDPRTLFPFDKDTMKNSVAKTGRLLIVHEGPKTMGFGAEIAAVMAEEMFEYLAAPVRRITSLDTPVAFAPALEDYTMPKVEEIIQAVRELTEF
jgi:pyruvate/2-oxoglutarate/acetoin dehydrogenase E1 component